MIRIYGLSDDLVEIDGDARGEICADGARVYVGDEATRQGCLVTMRYRKNGRWCAEVSLLGNGDDDAEIPWPVRVTQSSDALYSVAVHVDCPPGTKLRLAKLRGH